MTTPSAAVPRTGPDRRLAGLAGGAMAWLPALALLVASISADMVAIAGRDPIGIWRLLPAGPVHGSWLNAEVSSTFLLLVAIALLRAKRAGYWLALAVLVAAIVSQGAFNHDPAGAAVATILVIVLAVTRERYVVRTSRRDLALAAVLVAFGAIAVLVDGLTAGSGTPAVHTERLLAGWLDGGAIGRLSLASGLAVLLVIARVALIAAVVVALDPADDPRDDSTRQRARVALRGVGRGALLPYQLGPMAEPYATSDGQGVLAFARAGHTAIVLGDPAGDPAASRRGWGEWLELCRKADWQPAIYQATAEFRSTLVDGGWHAIKVGSEALLDPTTFDMSTPRLANLRHTVTRARKGGLSVHTSSRGPRDLPPTAGPPRLGELDAEWLGAAGPRLGFTVGQFDAMDLEGCVIAAATDAADRLVAFAVFRPTGADQGWMLDLMRRRRGGVPGAVELCVQAGIEVLAGLGVRRVSLGLAPLARLDRRRGPLDERLLGALAAAARPIYDVDGLAFFKDKFDPTWEERFLVVPRIWALPGAGLALLRLHLGGSWQGIVRSISVGIAGAFRSRRAVAGA